MIGLPGSAAGDEAIGGIDHRARGPVNWSLRFEGVTHAGKLLEVPALDIEQTFAVDFEYGEGAAHQTRRRATHDFGDDAGLSNALSGKIGNAGDGFSPQHSHEGCVGQRVQGVVGGDQEQLRR